MQCPRLRLDGWSSVLQKGSLQARKRGDVQYNEVQYSTRLPQAQGRESQQECTNSVLQGYPITSSCFARKCSCAARKLGMRRWGFHTAEAHTDRNAATCGQTSPPTTNQPTPATQARHLANHPNHPNQHNSSAVTAHLPAPTGVVMKPYKPHHQR
jgi:hypothetical protein